MSIFGKEFDDAAEQTHALIAKLNYAINPAELRETLATFNRIGQNLLEVSEKLREIAGKFDFKETAE